MTTPKPQRLREIIDRFDQCGILVFGDAMLDEYWWGSVSRISPEAPVPVVEIERSEQKPGGAANVALNVAALGGTPRLVAVVGNDRGRELLFGNLQEKGLDIDGLVVDPGRPTTRKTRIIGHHQQVVRADFESTVEVSPSVQAALWDMFTARLEHCQGVIISDYGKGVITSDLLCKIIEKTRAEGKFVVVDPKDTHFFSYQRATTLTPNHHEAGFVAGRRIRDEETLRQVGFDLLNRLQAESLLITRGEQGMALFEPPDVLTHFPTRATKVYDVTGAGDTVISAVSMALAADADMKEAAYLSNFAAGIVVREIGTAQTTRETLAEEVFSVYSREPGHVER
jgi:rfaE bifunctional protein kinase chain/domain